MEISRTEQKRRIKQLEQLVVEISQQPQAIIRKIPLEEDIRTLFKEIASLKGGAKKRQIKYITKILRKEPLDDLYSFMANRQGSDLEQKKRFHELEFFRDRLLSEAIEQQSEARKENLDFDENWHSEVVGEIKLAFESIDTLELSRIAHHYCLNRNRKYSREIFRLLKAAQEQQETDSK